MLLLLPRVTGSVVTTLRAQPGLSFLFGFVLLVTIPVAVLMLVISIFGLPAGFAMAALFGVALLVGLVTTALLVGEAEARVFGTRLLGHRTDRMTFLLAGVLTIGVMRMVPLIGGWVVIASVLFGLGAVGLSLYRNVRPSPTVQPG